MTDSDSNNEQSTPSQVQLDPSAFTAPEVSRLPEALQSEALQPETHEYEAAGSIPCSRDLITDMSWDDLAGLDDDIENVFTPPMSDFVLDVAKIHNILKKLAADELFASIDDDKGVVEIYNPCFADPVYRIPQKLFLDL